MLDRGTHGTRASRDVSFGSDGTSRHASCECARERRASFVLHVEDWIESEKNARNRPVARASGGGREGGPQAQQLLREGGRFTLQPRKPSDVALGSSRKTTKRWGPRHVHAEEHLRFEKPRRVVWCIQLFRYLSVQVFKDV